MLNFILSNTNPKARLNEDVTRFLAFQLVAAIRYLHFKNIAYEHFSAKNAFFFIIRSFFPRHCDLKPDNVLINIFPDDVVHLKVGTYPSMHALPQNMTHVVFRYCMRTNSTHEYQSFSSLGDFGYARTIHEHSLRYTKVGTTAYLPPEVSHDQWRHARGYNKTVEYVFE